MKIRSTVYPSTRLEQNEWMKEYRVASRVPKYDGVDRARKIMKEYDTFENRNIFKRLIAKLNTNHNHEEDQHRSSTES